MALPSPVAQLPDFSPLIQQTRANANNMFQRSWSEMQGLGPAAVAPAGAQAGGPLSEEMSAWRRGRDPEGALTGGPKGSLAPIANDRFAQAGFADNVPRTLIGTESGGNWMAENDEVGSGGKAGHFGILQFGHDRLEDVFRAGIIPRMTPEQFKKNEGAQIAAANWHFADIDSRIRKAGFDSMINKTVGGAPITWNGMRAMAHLGGFGGLSKYLNSGGAHNPADAYGTSLKDYAITHSKGHV